MRQPVTLRSSRFSQDKISRRRLYAESKKFITGIDIAKYSAIDPNDIFSLRNGKNRRVLRGKAYRQGARTLAENAADQNNTGGAQGSNEGSGSKSDDSGGDDSDDGDPDRKCYHYHIFYFNIASFTIRPETSRKNKINSFWRLMKADLIDQLIKLPALIISGVSVALAVKLILQLF